MVNKTVDLLNLVRGATNGTPGLRIVTVCTSDPNPVTLVFEGTQLALDLDIFEVPPSCYPLRVGDRFITYPIVGNSIAQRWAIIEKLNGGPIYMGTMYDGSNVVIDGMETPVSAVVPPYVAVNNATGSDGDLAGSDIRPLQSGDRVSVMATYDAGIKYVILYKY